LAIPAIVSGLLAGCMAFSDVTIATKVDPLQVCNAKAAADDCFSCCDTTLEPGKTFRDREYRNTWCAMDKPPPCADICGFEYYCSRSPMMPSDACDQCVTEKSEEIFAMDDRLALSCSNNSDCAGYNACYSQCFSKFPAGPSSDAGR
jgi:hypothetical protein